jgi:hypothetical protein
MEQLKAVVFNSRGCRSWLPAGHAQRRTIREHGTQRNDPSNAHIVQPTRRQEHPAICEENLIPPTSIHLGNRVIVKIDQVGEWSLDIDPF